ncbi:Casein kinase II subunit beta [Mycena sanguinolenta]|uniref:Casein kinase II subunit beta n=1 Tax=Mycena sanguinolenta TaxID=230812 RepID=A0A8H6YBE3_9AGAR|nr:Casein kinase II subunit beta [Mycena sanguinolenta]
MSRQGEEDNISGGDEVMEEPEEQEDGYTSSTPTSTLTWISWFCSLPGHEYFCEVTEDFIEDDFNLTGLNSMVPFWKEAMEMVLDVEPDEDASKIPDVSIVESSAEMLYGLVHQRYILGRAGQQAMGDKYESGIFGSCPRVYCVGCNVVPCGRSDLPGIDTVKLFCPNCNDIYVPPSSAFFGTTFAHLFFQNYRESAPAPFWKAPSSSGSLSPRTSAAASRSSPFVNPNPYGGQKRAAGYVYVPRIYGFKVSDRAKCGPRMQWLRLRPETAAELDQVDLRGRWIDDEYEDDEDEQDRQMEDFDPDAGDDDDDDEEEEEEEDEEDGGGATRRYTTFAGRGAGSADVTECNTTAGWVYGCSITTATHRGEGEVDTDDDMARTDIRYGLNHGHPTTPIPKTVRPSHRKGVSSTKTKFVRSVVREVAGFSAYERRVMELLRNSKDKKARKLTKKRLGTLLRSKRKLEELQSVIQESRRAAH